MEKLRPWQLQANAEAVIAFGANTNRSKHAHLCGKKNIVCSMQLRCQVAIQTIK